MHTEFCFGDMEFSHEELKAENTALKVIIWELLNKTGPVTIKKETIQPWGSVDFLTRHVLRVIGNENIIFSAKEETKQ